ncbi:MAG: SpoIIIAH-like family protein [Lachnospiraceae bacterium]|nr:SpoIIIAH-like family protein [Lachnospiraceae bacterium]
MVKKNQVIITALAIMIAVAGYLNFAGSKVNDEELVKKTGSTAVQDELNVSDISDEDMYSAEMKDDGSVTDVTDASDGTYTEYTEIESLDSDSDAFTASNDTDETVPSTPGEAILTNSSKVGVGVVANAKLMKEQTRAKNKETLLDVINNASIGDDQKQTAINEMISMTDISERETAAEILLAAKGFTDSIVSITGDSADVVVNSTELTDAQRAQIEDIVKRKTGVSAENLVITPLS